MRARLSNIGFFLLCLLPSLATAESLAGVQSQAEQQLQQAEQKLAALRKEIEADTVPLTRKLNELEEKLTQVKTQFEDVDRTLASKQLENTNLQSEVKRKTEENAYLGSLMEEFSRGMETKLFSGEAGRYKPILESAKAAVGNPVHRNWSAAHASPVVQWTLAVTWWRVHSPCLDQRPILPPITVISKVSR
jgi:hypothetical protein